MVKNEADIVESFVRHVFDQGFDRLLIVDNGSTDETCEILQRLASEFPLILGEDREFGYYQAHKMSRLAAVARRAGAAWVVPMDADEFWFAEEGTVGTFLSLCPSEQVAARMHNVFPTLGNEVLSGPTGPVRLDRHPAPHGKAAARPRPGMWIGMGNHRIDRPGLVVTGLRILHVPWRSKRQFAQKVKQGAAALAATDLPEDLGGHWRSQAKLSLAEIDRRWSRLLLGQPSPDMDWTPSGDTVVLESESWGSWADVSRASGVAP